MTARKPRSAPRRVLALGALLAALWAWNRAELAQPRGADALLAGPLAPALATARWTRACTAIEHGALGPGFADARAALALCPHSGPLWAEYARLLALQLGSVEREPDPQRRADWLRAGLAALDEVERVGGDRGGCALARGFLLYTKAEHDPELAWPGGPAALREAAAQAFAAARAHGNAAALELAWQPPKHGE